MTQNEITTKCTKNRRQLLISVGHKTHTNSQSNN